MGISQQIGASSLSKPGVCTSSTRPATPYEGQMIYETDTDLTYIYGGAAWQQITGGTAVGNSGLVYVTSATIGTGVSTVTVSSAFSATYDNYRIVVSGGYGSDDPQNILMTLGSTSTNYYWARVGRSFADVDGGGASGGSTSSWRIGGITPQIANFAADIFNPFLSDETAFASSNLYARTAGSIYFVGGYLNNTTSYTAFTLVPGAGTLTGGTVTVYGYRKG